MVLFHQKLSDDMNVHNQQPNLGILYTSQIKETKGLLKNLLLVVKKKIAMHGIQNSQKHA